MARHCALTDDLFGQARRETNSKARCEVVLDRLATANSQTAASPRAHLVVHRSRSALASSCNAFDRLDRARRLAGLGQQDAKQRRGHDPMDV